MPRDAPGYENVNTRNLKCRNEMPKQTPTSSSGRHDLDPQLGLWRRASLPRCNRSRLPSWCPRAKMSKHSRINLLTSRYEHFIGYLLFLSSGFVQPSVKRLWPFTSASVSSAKWRWWRGNCRSKYHRREPRNGEEEAAGDAPFRSPALETFGRPWIHPASQPGRAVLKL